MKTSNLALIALLALLPALVNCGSNTTFSAETQELIASSVSENQAELVKSPGSTVTPPATTPAEPEKYCSKLYPGRVLAGSPYSVPTTMDCGGRMAHLRYVYFGVNNSEGARYLDPNCQVFLDIYLGHGVFSGLFNRPLQASGIVPQDDLARDINSTSCQHEGGSSSRWLKYSGAGWSFIQAHYEVR